MSETRTVNDPSDFYDGGREPPWTAWLALAVTLLGHLALVLVLPERWMPVGQGDDFDALPREVYEISLIDPVEARFVEASRVAPDNEPDRIDQYSYRAQQAADESPLEDAMNQPNVAGEENSQKILQGTQERTPTIVPGVYAPTAQAGEGEGADGGLMGQQGEAAMLLPTQALPAPAFIDQDAFSQEGPGSRLDWEGDAPEVFEQADLDAPIDVYRPKATTEAIRTPGDGAGRLPEAQPRPRARPRLAPELITGPLMRSPGSASRRGSIAIDATFSEFGEYEQQFYATIQTGWYQEIDFFQPIDIASRVHVRFTIHADGRVTDVQAVETTASDIATFICETAITKGSPFRAWTRDMVKVFGTQRELNVVFHYR